MTKLIKKKKRHQITHEERIFKHHILFLFNMCKEEESLEIIKERISSYTIINSSDNSFEPSHLKKNTGTFVCKLKFEYKRAKEYILFNTNIF